MLSPEPNSQNINAHVSFSLGFALSTTLQLGPAGRNIWYLATEHSCTCRWPLDSSLSREPFSNYLGIYTQYLLQIWKVRRITVFTSPQIYIYSNRVLSCVRVLQRVIKDCVNGHISLRPTHYYGQFSASLDGEESRCVSRLVSVSGHVFVLVFRVSVFTWVKGGSHFHVCVGDVFSQVTGVCK